LLVAAASKRENWSHRETRPKACLAPETAKYAEKMRCEHRQTGWLRSRLGREAEGRVAADQMTKPAREGYLLPLGDPV
jgi:hypothetical protein